MAKFTLLKPGGGLLSFKTDFGFVVALDPTDSDVVKPACPRCANALVKAYANSDASCLFCHTAYPAFTPAQFTLGSLEEREVLEGWLSSAKGGPDPLAAVLLASDLLAELHKRAAGVRSSAQREQKRAQRARVKRLKAQGMKSGQARSTVKFEERRKNR